MPSDHSSLRLLAVTIVLLTLATACRHEPVYPPLLVEADSAFVQGDYRCADSLLAAYDEATDSTEAGGGVLAYRQYLALTRKYVRDQLTDEDFSLADSLCRNYHKRGTREKRGRSLLFLGDIYRLTDDNPSALNCYLQAEKLARQTGSTILMAWACQAIGDTYFDQRMLDDCMAYYRRFFHIAETRHDTLRMAHASQRMGRVYTIESNVDSTLFYHEQAATLGRIIGRDDFVRTSHSLLADIYIQIEEFDKAAELMEKDSMNLYNWACWYYGQHDLDSAICYYQKSMGMYNIQVDAECLEMLADMFAEKGDFHRSSEYYALLHETEDSIKILSQKEETRKTHAQYNYTSIKQERDSLVKKQRNTHKALICIVLVGLSLAILTNISVKRYRKRKELELVRERLYRQEEENKLRESVGKIEENRKRIQVLETALDEARKHNNLLEVERLKTEAELLSLKNQQIENARRQERLKLEEFGKAELYRKIKPVDGSTPQRLREEEWLQLAHYMDDIYNHFTSRLTALAKLSANDLKICYLTKMGVQPADIASLLFVTKSAITLARRRMWKKITGEEGSALQFDEYIRAF